MVFEDAGGRLMSNLDTVANWAQILSLPLTVIVMLVSFWVAWLQRRRKELEKRAELIPLTRGVNGYAERMEVLYDGKPVLHPHLATIRLRNSGNVPITAQDFAAPLTFRFGEQSEILHAEVSEKYPGNLGMSVQIEKGTVKLKPGLLNPKDGFVLRVLGGRIDSIEIDHRIVGVRDIVDARRGPPSARVGLGTALFLLALVSLALALQSAFVWGFIAAGLFGFVMQRLRIFLLTKRVAQVG